MYHLPVPPIQNPSLALPIPPSVANWPAFRAVRYRSSVVLMTALRRIGVAMALSLAVGFGMMFTWGGSISTLFIRVVVLGLAAMAAFSLFEAWPHRLPSWIQRWILQVMAVGVFMPLTTTALYVFSTPLGAGPFWSEPARWSGWLHLTIAGLLISPWTAVVAIVRQREAVMRDQELTFALERSELERQALDAKVRVLQAQVAPHFLFNTLATVQALVDSGSPHASAVLRSLTAYLRAAVPLLNQSAATIDRELQLVRPYLELMQMRMPDRLRYDIRVDPSVMHARCPPTTVLTLVENAVRHGIDPAEDGGRIEVDIERRAQRCLIRVTDTGGGLHHAASGLGTGLITLRERLDLAFGAGGAHLRLASNAPRGTIAEIDMPFHS